MRSLGFQNFQQCCFRLPDWLWSNSTRWMGQLFSGNYFNDSPWFILPRDSSCRPFPLTRPIVIQKMGLFPRNELKQFSAKRNLFSNKKMSLEVVSAKYRPFCLGHCDIHYIPRNMHTAWLFVVLLWSWYNQLMVYFLLARFIVGFNSLVPGIFE